MIWSLQQSFFFFLQSITQCPEQPLMKNYSVEHANRVLRVRTFTLQQSCWGFSFALRHGILFFHGIQHSPIDGCTAVSCNFGVQTGEDERTSYYSAILIIFSTVGNNPLEYPP